ncbi:MAG: hypothetical protein IPO81_09420 [Kouleothrix sp.]|nr:hypothetical protein [Kouleothrix sp.]
MSDLALVDQATVYADELPQHAAQIAHYEAAGLTRGEAFQLEVRAARVISLIRRNALELGQELALTRDEAKHGTWGAFLERCDLTERTAENVMNVWRRFRDTPEIISALKPTALYLMSAPSADSDVVAAIVEEVQRGAPAPSVTEVKQRLAAKSAAPAAGAPPSPKPAAPAARGPAAAAPRSAAAATDDGEIAAAGPALRPLPPPLPALIRIVADGMMDGQARKLLVAKRALLAETIAQIDAQLAITGGPTIVIRREHAQEAARLFVNSQALGGAAAMLAFSAVVEEVE